MTLAGVRLKEIEKDIWTTGDYSVRRGEVLDTAQKPRSKNDGGMVTKSIYHVYYKGLYTCQAKSRDQAKDMIAKIRAGQSIV